MQDNPDSRNELLNVFIIYFLVYSVTNYTFVMRF